MPGGPRASQASRLVCCIVEFVGTFVLTLTFNCNAVVGDPIWRFTALGFVFTSMNWALGDVSGAHFNPAVTLTWALARKFSWWDVLPYVLAQLLAGAAGGLAYASLLDMTVPLRPEEGFGVLEAGAVELIFTAGVCFVGVSSGGSSRHAGKDQFSSLATGLVLAAVCPAALSISGGVLNPAIALATNVAEVGAKKQFFWFFVYALFEILGGIAAAVLFYLCRPEDGQGPASQSPVFSKLIGEFYGTLMSVVIFGFSIHGGSRSVTWSLAAMWISLTYAIHSISGAHLNPAVTLAVLLGCRGRISFGRSFAYMIVQALGGFCGALVVLHFVQSASPVDYVQNLTVRMGSNPVVTPATAELVFSFLLCYVYLCVAAVRRPLTQYFGLVIGMCAAAGGFAAGNISAAAQNPAVSLGMYYLVPKESRVLKAFLANSAAQFLAAALAAAVFVLTHPSEQGVQRVLTAKDVDGFVPEFFK